MGVKGERKNIGVADRVACLHLISPYCLLAHRTSSVRAPGWGKHPAVMETIAPPSPLLKTSME